jgi:hypothetical protein
VVHVEFGQIYMLPPGGWSLASLRKTGTGPSNSLWGTSDSHFSTDSPYMQSQANLIRLVLNEGFTSALDYYTTSARVEPKIQHCNHYLS